MGFSAVVRTLAPACCAPALASTLRSRLPRILLRHDDRKLLSSALAFSEKRVDSIMTELKVRHGLGVRVGVRVRVRVKPNPQP